MKRGSRPEWIVEAVSRLGKGETLASVAERFGVTARAVKWAIEGCAEEEDAAKRRIVRATPGKDHIVPPAPLVVPRFVHDTSPLPKAAVEPMLSWAQLVRHVYRTPRDLIRRREVMPAALLFARHEISRKQLIERITVRQPVVIDDQKNEG